MPQLSVAVGRGMVTLAVQLFIAAFTTTLDTQLMTGAWVSVITTFWLHVFVLPLTSVTVHTSVVVPTGKLPDVAEPVMELTTEATPQLSLTTGAVSVTVLEHAPAVAGCVIVLPHDMAGGCVSFTVTVKEHVAWFRLTSVAVHVTVVVPTGYVPDAFPVLFLLFTSVGTPQLSVTAGTGMVTDALQLPAVLLTIMFDVHPITGACVSFTFTVIEHVLTLPVASVTVHRTVVVPTG